MAPGARRKQSALEAESRKIPAVTNSSSCVSQVRRGIAASVVGPRDWGHGHTALVAASGILPAARTRRRRGPAQDRAAEEWDARGPLPPCLDAARPLDLHITRSLNSLVGGPESAQISAHLPPAQRHRGQEREAVRWAESRGSRGRRRGRRLQERQVPACPPVSVARPILGVPSAYASHKFS
jgi:hypothetical protein